MRQYFVYILSSSNRTLYIGVTNDLERRIHEHKLKLIPGFTARYNITQLVHFEVFADIRDAIAREKQLKTWLRRKKVSLVLEHNAGWKDLSA